MCLFSFEAPGLILCGKTTPGIFDSGRSRHTSCDTSILVVVDAFIGMLLIHTDSVQPLNISQGGTIAAINESTSRLSLGSVFVAPELT